MQTFINTPEDMKWLRDVHKITAKAAVIFGNADCPDRIEAYSQSEPMIWDKPNVYTRNADGLLTNGFSIIR